MERVSRRLRVLLPVFMALFLVMAACSEGDGGTANTNTGGGAAFPSSPPASEDKGPLKVLTFAGYDSPESDAVFKAQFPDVKVEYQFGDSNEDFFQKISTGAASPDIVFGACVNFLPNWQEANLIAPIDTSRLENWADQSTDLQTLGVIGGTQYEAVGYYGYDSLIVATDRPPVPAAWADLWSPKMKGRFAMIDYAENGVQMTAVVLGLPYPDLTSEQLDQIKAKLLELRPNIRSFWQAVADPVQQISTGEVDMFYGWPNQYKQALDAGQQVEFLNPTEGRLSFVCGSVVMADTEHYDLALKWIDARLSAEAGAAFINTNYYGHPNSQALAQADQAIVTGLGYDDPEIFRNSHLAAALTAEQRQSFNQMWAEVVAGG